MALEKDEYLWRMINEHMTQARHQETLRASITTMLVTLTVAIVGFITFDKELSLTDIAPAILVCFLGTFGIFFSRKHYERFNFHIAHVRSYRKALEQDFPSINWKELRDEADMYHKSKFPIISKFRQHILWQILHFGNTLLGLILVVLILRK